MPTLALLHALEKKKGVCVEVQKYRFAWEVPHKPFCIYIYMYMYIDMGRRPAPTILYSFCEPCGGKPLWFFFENSLLSGLTSYTNAFH